MREPYEQMLEGFLLGITTGGFIVMGCVVYVIVKALL